MKRRVIRLFAGLWLVVAATAAAGSPQNETDPAAPSEAGPSWSYSNVDGHEAYQRGDYRAALRIWRLMAEQDDPVAQYNIGVMYQQGRGVSQSRAEAEAWFRLAASNGDLQLRLLAGQRLMDLVMQSVPVQDHIRVALVIGNSAYQHAAALPSPANDARDMASLLTRLGFEVTLVIDQDHRSALDGMIEFASRAEGADIAAVYYAGHGIEVDGQNYLLPVDTQLTADQHVSLQTLSLNYVLRAVENAQNLGLVILDAARGNPFADNARSEGIVKDIGQGLARIEPPGSSVLVAYAAGAGDVAPDGDGPNSPYTAALLEHLDDPGIGIRQMFNRVRDAVMRATQRRQQPFTSHALGGQEIVLTGGGDATR